MPDEERMVAQLKLPLPARGLDRLVTGLEAVYGPGLMMGPSEGDWVPIFLPVS